MNDTVTLQHLGPCHFLSAAVKSLRFKGQVQWFSMQFVTNGTSQTLKKNWQRSVLPFLGKRQKPLTPKKWRHRAEA